MRSLSETKPCTIPGWEPVREFAFESPVKSSNIFVLKMANILGTEPGEKRYICSF